MYNEYGDWYYFKRPYRFYSCLVGCTYMGNIFDGYVWTKLNPAISNLKTSKEEKKMHKKTKIEGHVAHVLYDKYGHSSEYLYTVNPEKHEVVAWLPIYTYGDPDALPEYNRYEWVRIIPNMLGRHGYLQEAIRELQTAVFGSERTAYRARDILAKIASFVCDDKKNLKEEKKMGEIGKDRITLDASEGCYLELFNGSNTIVFHFGTQSQVVTVPNDYEIDWGIKEQGTCDLKIVKKKPKLLNMKITIEGKVFRDGFYFDYIPEPRDIVKLRFMDGRLTHYTLADDPNRELIAGPGNIPGALYHIYKRDKPYRHVKELRESLHEIYSKRVMWQNASYVTFTPHNLTD